MIAVISRLLDTIDRRWQDRNYEEREFCEIAVSALNEARLCEELTISDLVRWFNHERGPAPQINIDSSFGEPPLTLASTSRFYIEALFWLDGTTSIHQHRFSGAFSVLTGSSIHTRHTFEHKRRINASTVVGILELDDVEFLQPGQVRPIKAGTGTVHSVFHLDRPTVSIVVRTMVDHDAGPQFDFWPPSIARDPSLIDTRLKRQIQLVRTLSRVAAPDRFQHAHELLQRLDFASSLPILDALVSTTTESWSDIMELIEAVRVRHTNVDVDLVPVFAERRRLSHLIARRKQVHDPELRLFLAMLLNLPTQAACVRFLRMCRPDRDPESQLCEWIDRLGAMESQSDDIALLLTPLTN